MPVDDRFDLESMPADYSRRRFWNKLRARVKLGAAPLRLPNNGDHPIRAFRHEEGVLRPACAGFQMDPERLRVKRVQLKLKRFVKDTFDKNSLCCQKLSDVPLD